MKSSAKKVELASVDDLFSTEESRADAQREKVLEIPLSELHPFKDHPFKVKDDEAMMETADSIRQYGVLVPAIARPDPNGGYELVAGHRRHRASELAGKDTMPVIVRDLDDDQATIIMVDSNLQRESLLPSERAFAYKMKLEAMKRQAGRPSKENCSQLGNDFGKKSSEVLAEQVGQSKNQIFRYIRLTELIPELLDMVDEKKIAFNPAYELSFLKKEEQRDLLDAMDSEQATPSLSQAQRLKKYSQEGHLTLDMMRVIMGEEKKNDLDKIAELREVTSYDELELDTLGDRRTALFLIMSDTDDSFNFLISMCYTQLFNLLCEKADDVYGGRLPVHVRCLIDECANIGQIPKLEKLVATIRSREISACLVLQAQSQLKAIYKDNADTIIGNMDSSIFLGGKEPTTLKELEAVLGKETIDTYNTGESRGRETSHSLNYQKLGKALMSQDELAVMDGGKCILQLRGVRPFLSDKYDITQHPNYKYTADADPKNAFDIEGYLKARLKLKPNQVCDVYEIDAAAGE